MVHLSTICSLFNIALDSQDESIRGYGLVNVMIEWPQ
jgi:hypothetical protein